MNIKLDHKILNSEIADKTLSVLRQNEQKLPVEARYRLGVISQTIYFERLKVQAEAKRLLEIYAKKDEKGAIIGFPDQSKIEFTHPERERAYDESLTSYLKRLKFKVNCAPILLSDLKDVSVKEEGKPDRWLTMEELLSIEPILRDL